MSGPAPVDDLRAREPQPNIVPWRAREGIPLLILSFVAMAILMVAVAVLVAEEDWRRMIAVLLQEAALILLVVWWIRRQYDVGPERLALRAPTSSDLSAGFATGFIGIVLAVATSILMELVIENFTETTVKNPEQLGLERDPSAGLLVLIGVAVIVFAPLAEEVFWRGFIFRAFRRTMAVGSAIVWSGLLFGAIHLTAATSWDLLGQYIFTLAIPIGVLGCLLAALTERTRSIVPAIIAHAMFNAFGFAMLMRDMV